MGHVLFVLFKVVYWIVVPPLVGAVILGIFLDAHDYNIERIKEGCHFSLQYWSEYRGGPQIRTIGTTALCFHYAKELNP